MHLTDCYGMIDPVNLSASYQLSERTISENANCIPSSNLTVILVLQRVHCEKDSRRVEHV